jgi:uncharacterized protein
MYNKTKIAFLFATVTGLILLAVFFNRLQKEPSQNLPATTTREIISESEQLKQEKLQAKESFSMEITALRERIYPGGNFEIKEVLPNGSNYRQSIVSYRSEGLKIYGLLTVPLAVKPQDGYPAIIFIHGHIPPKQYSTTGSYPSYQATLARSGMMTFKPDLRGHGNSEGEPASAHFSEKYLVDTLFAISHLKNHADVDPERLGYWGHSNGGETGLRTAVISPDIKAYVLWAGVVGSFEHILETYNSKIPFLQDAKEEKLVRENGLPSQNHEFWKKIDPYFHLENISAPIQLHHGTADDSVPVELSRELKTALETAGKNVTSFEYVDDHNIARNSTLAWERSIRFFKENL